MVQENDAKSDKNKQNGKDTNPNQKSCNPSQQKHQNEGYTDRKSESHQNPIPVLNLVNILHSEYQL